MENPVDLTSEDPANDDRANEEPKEESDQEAPLIDLEDGDGNPGPEDGDDGDGAL